MKYKIILKTGNQQGAGTDADVYLQIFGSKNHSDEIKLQSKLSQFEKNSVDIFYVESTDLGRLEKLKVWHNNKLLGAEWLLNEIVIESDSSENIWYFPVNKWIKKDEKKIIKSVKHCVYNFEITTGTLPGSGTSDAIEISIIGSESYTPFIWVNQYISDAGFKSGHTENFSILSEDVGKIKEVQIRCKDEVFNSNWFLTKINVKTESEKLFSQFPFHKWISKGKIYSANKKLVEYTIKFYTGDVGAGGTDANITMVIYGTRGETNPIKLNELIARNAFEAGKIDYIKLAHKNLGSIKKIRIWHDEKWLGDGWFLNKIKVKNENTGVKAKFSYYSWLDKSADPKSNNILLTKNPIKSRPFYVIAHMVNTPAYLEEAIDLGSNAAEFDIMPKLKKNGKFSFDVFHGFRPDFDPDKINLMERSIARTDLTLFLTHLKRLENKHKNFSLVIYDCKLENVPKKYLEQCGKHLVQKVIDEFYSADDINRIYTIFSVGKRKSASFIDGIIDNIPKDFLPFIGFDFSMENFQTTENIFNKRNKANFWWGSGIASTVPKPLKHFIPQFLIAAKKRTKRGIIKKIYYWTLDDPDSMARILVTKLDGIIVNDPLKLLKVLEKEEFRYAYRLATRDDDPFSII